MEGRLGCEARLERDAPGVASPALPYGERCEWAVRAERESRAERDARRPLRLCERERCSRCEGRAGWEAEPAPSCCQYFAIFSFARSTAAAGGLGWCFPRTQHKSLSAPKGLAWCMTSKATSASVELRKCTTAERYGEEVQLSGHNRAKLGLLQP